MRNRARLHRVTEKLKPAGRKRVFLKNDGDDGWMEYVAGEAVHRADAEVDAAEAGGDDVTCIVIEHVDNWRGELSW